MVAAGWTCTGFNPPHTRAHPVYYSTQTAGETQEKNAYPEVFQPHGHKAKPFPVLVWCGWHRGMPARCGTQSLSHDREEQGAQPQRGLPPPGTAAQGTHCPSPRCTPAALKIHPTILLNFIIRIPRPHRRLPASCSGDALQESQIYPLSLHTH